jgi:hypothetical protein
MPNSFGLRQWATKGTPQYKRIKSLENTPFSRLLLFLQFESEFPFQTDEVIHNRLIINSLKF